MFSFVSRGPAPKLSVCVVIQDQAPLVPRLLANLDPVADEIVAVDGGSKDDTRALLAAHPKVRLLDRPFDTHPQQKNFAIDQATGDWVLLLDSDELLGDRLRERLPALLRKKRARWYKLPRYWLVSLEPLRYVHAEKLYPDQNLRLFRNDPFFRYEAGQAIHERFPREGRGRGEKLKGEHLFHLDFLLNDRAARERKVARYEAVSPSSSGTNRMYLYEDLDHEIRPCREALSI